LTFYEFINIDDFAKNQKNELFMRVFRTPTP